MDTPTKNTHTEAQETLQTSHGGGERDCENSRIRDFAVRPCLLVMSEATSIKSHQHDSLHMDECHSF